MTAFFAIGSLASVVFVCIIMAWVESRSPYGYEDDSRFHLGDEPHPTR